MIPLVAIGDSLTQGFRSGSIHRSDLSFPALLSYAMGTPPGAFRVPDFFGEGGLPIDLERLIRNLAAQHGAEINPFEFVAAVATLRGDLDRVEDYWERGPGSRVSDTGPLHHNLAVWGFEIDDPIGSPTRSAPNTSLLPTTAS